MRVQTCIDVVLGLVVIRESFDFMKSHREEAFLLPKMHDHADLTNQLEGYTYLLENISGRVAEEHELLVDE